MASMGGMPMELIAEARLNRERVPVALILSGAVLSAAALALIIFKAPPAGVLFLRLHGSTPVLLYYGILTAITILGLAEASFGYWVVPRDLIGWHAAGKTVLWVSLLPLVLVLALGGLALLIK